MPVGESDAAGLMYPNGVDGLTGDHLSPPLDPAEIARWIRDNPEDRELQDWLGELARTTATPSFGLPFNVTDPASLAQVGWAVVFASDEAPEVKDALAPLVAHRRRQAGHDARVKVLEFAPNETWLGWLARHDTGPGNVDPEKVPYYVLLIGSPSRIPFGFQYLLDVEYGVGRLDFDDADGYRRYVAALIEYEEGRSAPRSKTAALFGTRHPFERATQLSADGLVTPLARGFQPGGRFADDVGGYRVESVVGPPATKERLSEILAGTTDLGGPGLLFAATHGLGGWPIGHPRQTACHGALLCQDWPGGAVAPSHYVSGADVTADGRVHGMVAFLFACYGAGTPRWNAYPRSLGGPPAEIAAAPFVAALPKALLSHPEGGALAVIGHIERAWSFSFLSAGQARLLPFQNAVGRILAGQPVGLAMKDFNERYAALSTNLSKVLAPAGFTRVVEDAVLVRTWMERNDAQNYVVIGDPAVRLRAA